MINKIKQWYGNKKLSVKMIIIVYMIVILMGLFLTAIILYFSGKAFFDENANANLNVVKQVNSSVEIILDDIESASKLLILDDDIQDYLIQVDDNNRYDLINNTISNRLISIENYFNSILIYDTTGRRKALFTNDGSSFGVDQLEGELLQALNKAIELRGKPVWLKINAMDNQILIDDPNGKICLLRAVVDLDTAKVIGVICVGSNISNIDESVFANINNLNEDSIVIIDDNQQVIVSKGTLEVLDYDYQLTNDFEVIIDESSNSVISYGIIDTTNWTTIYRHPGEKYITQLTTSALYGLYVILAFVLMFLPLLIYVSNNLTNPIKKIMIAMDAFGKGDFSIKVEDMYNDEFGEMARVFNSMVFTIAELIDKTYVLQLKEAEAELNVLQEQINPHFLYNMLDTIQWKAIRSGEDDIAEMANSLGKIFRMSLSRGEKFVPVSNEKELIDNYLKLQKMRFLNKLNYKIDFDYKILKLKIPKLIIQPFVENAVLHGIGQADKDCLITVKAYQESRCLCFDIVDDGKGMSLEVAKSLELNTLVKEKGGFGVKNVIERFNIYYKEASIKIESELNKGTSIHIRIPLDEVKNIDMI